MWILIIAFAVFAVFMFTRNRSQSARAVPEEILQNRYARGEISREEYREMIKDIKGE